MVPSELFDGGAVLMPMHALLGVIHIGLVSAAFVPPHRNVFKTLMEPR